jgi:hypothetical protein
VERDLRRGAGVDRSSQVPGRGHSYVNRHPARPLLANTGHHLLAIAASQEEEREGVGVELVGDEVADRRRVLARISPIGARAARL